jgi:hypothetical protein
MIEDTLERRIPTAKQASIARADEALEAHIEAATQALLARQRPDGHWVFELEADATIPDEYVLLRHYLGEPVDAALEAKIAVYLRRIQGEHGGWPLFRDGDLDVSATVKAYFALKMIGDSIDADHMRRARAAAPSAPTCSRASCWRCSASFPGGRCRCCRSRSCCCRGGFPFTSTRSRTGAAPSSFLCWC